MEIFFLYLQFLRKQNLQMNNNPVFIHNLRMSQQYKFNFNITHYMPYNFSFKSLII